MRLSRFISLADVGKTHGVCFVLEKIGHPSVWIGPNYPPIDGDTDFPSHIRPTGPVIWTSHGCMLEIEWNPELYTLAREVRIFLRRNRTLRLCLAAMARSNKIEEAWERDVRKLEGRYDY